MAEENIYDLQEMDGLNGYGGGRGKGRDQIPIPIFTGVSWRDFHRRVEAWRLSTNLDLEQQGPEVYARLQEEAWSAMEDIPLTSSSAGRDGRYVAVEDGLDFLMENLRARFEDQEILRQGDVLQEFFAQLRRRPGEQVRSFRRRFNTLVHRLARLSVVLPSIVLGWFFFEKLKLPNERRAMVLASANNDYEYEKVAAAAERNCANVAEFDNRQPRQERPPIS